MSKSVWVLIAAYADNAISNVPAFRERAVRNRLHLWDVFGSRGRVDKADGFAPLINLATGERHLVELNLVARNNVIRSARRFTEIRPERKNASQPDKETSLQLWHGHFAELDAHNSGPPITGARR